MSSCRSTIPKALLPNIRNAGAIFLGHHTPEAIGDYVGGSNHVLPTARSARFASGLGVLDFMKRTSLLGCDPSSLAALAAPAVTLAATEGLDAHGRSVPSAQPCSSVLSPPSSPKPTASSPSRSIPIPSPRSTRTRCTSGAIAIYDLVEDNKFAPARVKATGPYALHVSIVGNYIVLDVRNPETFEPIAAHYLSLTPFRRLIRDYFRIRDSYYEAIKSASSYQIETVDMARRGHPQRGRRAVAHPAREQAGDGPQHRPAAVHADLRGAALCRAASTSARATCRRCCSSAR